MSLGGLDVGTTVCRLIVFNENGKILTSVYREYPLITSKNWLEIDPERLWNSVCEVCREAALKVGYDPIEAIAVSAMGDTLIVTDKIFNPVRNAILAFDNRSKEACDQLINKYGNEKIFDMTGMPAHPMATATKIAWVFDNLKNGDKLIERFMCTEDFVIAKLTGNPVMSWSTAARTMMFDSNLKQWWADMLYNLGLSEGMLSTVNSSAAVAGKISTSAAENLGLSRDLLIVTAGHDQICSAIGSGAVKDGIVSDNTGTFECVIAGVGDEKKESIDKSILEKYKLAFYPHGPMDLWAAFAWFNAGSIVNWCRDNLFTLEAEKAKKNGNDIFDYMFDKISDEPVKMNCLPHFTGTGTPWLDPEANGVFLGLNLGTDRFDILKAVLQGIGYDLMLNFEGFEKAGINIKNIRATGGGTHSPKWMQLKADMTGKEVIAVTLPEASALGAAICAGTAAGVFNSIEEAAEQMVTLGKVFRPDISKHQMYRDGIESHLGLYNIITQYREKYGVKSDI